MKKNLLLTLAIGMAFVACKKEDIQQTSEHTIQIDGSTYEVNYIRNGLSKLLNIPIEKLIFNSQHTIFTHPDFNLVLDPSKFINDIKVLEEAGYDF